MFDYFKSLYLSPQKSEYEIWCEQNINNEADTLEDYFHNMEYIIEVNADKFLVYHMLIEPVDAFDKYSKANRKIGEHCEWFLGRFEYKHGKHYFIDGTIPFRAFVATNNKNDAIMLALEFS